MPRPLKFGPRKYAALHLLLGRWVRHHAIRGPHRYVTLGGTELADVESVAFIDRAFAQKCTAFEHERDRFKLALATKRRLETRDLFVDVKNEDFFGFTRNSRLPHLFFLDLEGTFIGARYETSLARMILEETLREGDALLVTSYLGRNRGWKRIFEEYSGEFAALNVRHEQEKREVFRTAHPSFTLYRALRAANARDELKFESFGCVRYRDTSPMGVYGFVFAEGETSFDEFLQSNGLGYFKIMHRDYGFEEAGAGQSSVRP